MICQENSAPINNLNPAMDPQMGPMAGLVFAFDFYTASPLTIFIRFRVFIMMA